MYINLNKIIDDYKIKIKGVIHVGAHKGEEIFSYYKNNIKDIILIEANKKLHKNLKFKKFFLKYNISNTKYYNSNTKFNF